MVSTVTPQEVAPAPRPHPFGPHLLIAGALLIVAGAVSLFDQHTAELALAAAVPWLAVPAGWHIGKHITRLRHRERA